MKVTFWLTRKDGSGQDLVATVTLSRDGQLAVDGPQKYLDMLFDRGQRGAGREAVEQAMREAPMHFDSAYLRAGFEE